jgi:hypothetical protein
MNDLLSKRRISPLTLAGMTVLLLSIPVSPGCICVEQFPTNPSRTITRSYQGYIASDDGSASVLFRLVGSFDRVEGDVEGTIDVLDDTTGVLDLVDLRREGRELLFRVTIPDLASGQLEFTTDLEDRFLTGTWMEMGGLEAGRIIGASVGDRTRTDFDMVGAYELVGSSTDTDTVTTEHDDDLSVRMEFEPDGRFTAVSVALSDSSRFEDTGRYSLAGDLLFVTLEGGQNDHRLPVSIRGFIVDKDVVLLSYPRPFPSYDSVVPVADGIQVEHFRQDY